MWNSSRAAWTASLAALGAAAWAAGVGSAPCDGAARSPIVASRGSSSPRSNRLPLAFEENRGQTAEEVRFLARAPGFTAFITPTETVLAARDDVVRMRLVGARDTAQVEGARALPGVANYFVGSDATKWLTDVPTYDGVAVRDAWPGIDVRWHGDAAGKLTYDVVLAAGADVSAVALRLDGAHEVSVDTDGSLRAATASGELRQTCPIAWQTVDGARRPVDVAFVVRPDGCVGFDVGAIDAGRELVIDPSVTWSTYLGGSGTDTFALTAPIAVDGAGALYLAGSTASTDFPVTSGVQGSFAGGTSDVFVTKIAAGGASIVWSTYLGGSAADSVDAGLAVDVDGAVLVAGTTASTDFPTQSALQATPGGKGDAFVAKIAPSGSALSWSTYLGGTKPEAAHDLALDAGGAVFVTGETDSFDFPTASPSQASHLGSFSDVFVAKVTPDGNALVWSTYLGGTWDESGHAIAVDSTGAACVAVSTGSADFPMSTVPGGVFLTRFSPDGSVVRATSLGYGDPNGIAIDASDAAYVVGLTGSSTFPATFPLQATVGVNDSAFLAKVDAAGALVWATYFGDSTVGNAVAVDWTGAATIVGYVRGHGLRHLIVDATQPEPAGDRDGFVTRFDPDGASLTFSTYLGGTGYDAASGVAVDASGNVFVTGSAKSTDFPTQSPLQAALSGSSDRFVVAYSLGADAANVAPAAPRDLVATYSAATGVTLSWTDASPLETRFRVERRPDGYTFARVGEAPADAEQFVDVALFPNATYSYRVRAEDDFGASRWSNEVQVATDGGVPVPPVPDAPTGLVADAREDGTVALSWDDNSSDEVLFEVERAGGGAAFVHIGDALPDSDGTSDAGVHPGWPGRYRVRAQSLQGPSGWSNTATAAPPSTFGVTVVAGRLADSPKPRRDKLRVVAKYDVELNPFDNGLDVVLGDDSAALALSIPALDPTWKLKAKRGEIVGATWRSARGALPKATVVIDFVRKRLRVTLASAEFPAPPTVDARLLVASGVDGSGAVPSWIERRPGVLSLKSK